MVPKVSESANLNSRLVLCCFLIGLDFKLVIVDKGRQGVWTSHFSLDVTNT